jgi:RNA polymerase sigma-70 factor (ECF subfamily)
MTASALALARWELLAVMAVPLAPEERLDLDASSVERAVRGDRRAFDEIYRRHVDAVYRRITRLVGPDSEREDLVQHVFIDAFRGLHNFRGDSLFSTWLHRIVANVAYEHLRRRKRLGRNVLNEAEIDRLIAETDSPETLARQREELSRVLRMLERIHPRKRIAFILRTVDGLSLEEIGTIVGANAPAVGQRVKHAQRELFQMIERDEKRRERRTTG